ncbi:probable LRR receptor-like serine/threonine-protein kinase MEE39 [Morus notabilis]|nr:probable LRR receptor-like serine/threonine-protein kinase MEE39 [Morus notabilis]
MKKKIWISLLLLLVLRVFVAYSLDLNFSTWWNIDCGNDVVRPPDLEKFLYWDTDEDLTQSGINARINPTTQVPKEMNTLRFFPDEAQKNCYSLPFINSQRYLIRAGFYYGNYDALSSPPTFDLYLDQKKWSTINTSIIEGSIYHEAVYVTRASGFLSLCLVQTKEGDVPFISSIEAVPLPSDLYFHLDTNYSFILVTRTNLGGDEVRYVDFTSDEKYNRIWTHGEIPSNCISVPTLPDISFTLENEPPNTVMSDSIQSRIATNPIIMTVDLPPRTPYPQLAYFIFYFNEIAALPGNTRTILIYSDGQMKSTVTTEFIKCKVVTIKAVTVAGPTINVTLGTTDGSTLPAIISAMEVFIRGESYEVANGLVTDEGVDELSGNVPAVNEVSGVTREGRDAMGHNEL